MHLHALSENKGSFTQSTNLRWETWKVVTVEDRSLGGTKTSVGHTLDKFSGHVGRFETCAVIFWV